MSEDTDNTSTSGSAPRGFSAGRTPNTPMDPVMKSIPVARRRVKPPAGRGEAQTPSRFLKRKCPAGTSLRAFARQHAGDGSAKDPKGTFTLSGAAVCWMASKKMQIKK